MKVILFCKRLIPCWVKVQQVPLSPFSSDLPNLGMKKSIKVFSLLNVESCEYNKNNVLTLDAALIRRHLHLALLKNVDLFWILSPRRKLDVLESLMFSAPLSSFISPMFMFSSRTDEAV